MILGHWYLVTPKLPEAPLILLARILTDRELIDTPIGGLALATAAVGDVLAWSMLAVLVALSHGDTPPWRVLLVLPFVAILMGVVRPLLARLAVNL